MAFKRTSRPGSATRLSPEDAKSLFLSIEEREVRETLKKEVEGSERVCRETMTALVLANHTGEKMDVIKDMLSRASRFGTLTEKQHSFAASIITKHHLDHVLDILSRTGAGEDTVVQPERVRMEEKAESPKARYEVSVTESNPNYGIF